MLHLQVESVVNGERPSYWSTSDGHPTKSRGRPDNNAGHNYELESYIAAFVQKSLSRARQMVDEAMQVGYKLAGNYLTLLQHVIHNFTGYVVYVLYRRTLKVVM
jgi:hypothetical protein